MTDGENSVLRFGERYQLVGFAEPRRDRFFHENVGSGIEEGAHNRRMRNRRRADADHVHRAQKVAPIRKDGYAVLDRRAAARVRADISHPDQADGVHPFIFRGVVPPKRPHSHDSGPNGAEALALECLQCKSPGRWHGL